MILSKFWSIVDLSKHENRTFLGDDQGHLSERTVLLLRGGRGITFHFGPWYLNRGTTPSYYNTAVLPPIHRRRNLVGGRVAVARGGATPPGCGACGGPPQIHAHGLGECDVTPAETGGIRAGQGRAGGEVVQSWGHHGMQCAQRSRGRGRQGEG